ncbi:MAG: CBS domain-containing protein [Candidatus Micrarchaeota archaeon]
MLVSELMRKEFISIDANQSLLYIIKLFAKHGVHEAPVINNKLFLGLVSDREISRAIVSRPWFKKPFMKSRDDFEGLKAIDVVNKSPLKLKPDDSVINAILDMGSKHINIIPVLDKGVLVGIITGKDIIQYLSLDIAKQTISKTDDSTVKSLIDSFLLIIRNSKKINAQKVAKMLKIRVEKAEEIAKALESHHLIAIEYSLSGNMILRDKNAGQI